MKLSKKIIVGSLAGILALGTGIPLSNQNISPVAAATTTNTNTLKLAHGAYVYNKKGQRLAKYRGSQAKTYLRKNANVKYAGTIQPIEKDSKQYYLLNDDNYNQSWLPYKKIKGKYYYNIGHGGYINAANVNEINGQPLYVASTTVTIHDKNKYDNFPKKGLYVGSGSDRILIKTGQKITVDRTSTIPTGNSTSVAYRIAGTTDTFVITKFVKNKPRQKLAIYTIDTYVGLKQNSNAYSISSILKPKITNKNVILAKNENLPVIRKIYVWVPKDNKAELFYRLNYYSPEESINYENAIQNQLFYVKAADAIYLSGPQLTPANTPEEAQADAKIATAADKQDLQKLIDQEKTITASSNYKNEDYVNTYKAQYDEALKQAKAVNSSTSVSISEVKEAVWYLTTQQQALLNATKPVNGRVEGTMPVN
ncbi:SLAP domain-containing protein [Lactobacillus sp. ESL0703]|uniref:SLAP domain-containing protein n=1 Tax=Lactobacillus sp. ESL0703 TaxID=2983218 RepID=UPI0023F6BC1E|nr:SLAP domain-containing protein [Lactobacillus sp. ESL0703]MDF7668661.1 SLAP domain-containing protein [Lactobacillus sp. ESL0703]